MMKIAKNRMQSAFTMIELVMVIVVLGIVSSIGAEIIAKVYENYILQRATHRANFKTELAAQQIANLLSYRIHGTTLARNPNDRNSSNDLNDTLLVTDPTQASDNKHTLLEWIGSDIDSFGTAIPPGWNGFCDLDASGQSAIKTPGSKLSLASTVMSKLSNGTVSLASSGKHPAIFFRNIRYQYDTSTVPFTEILYDPLSCMGMTGGSRNCISTVSRSGDETLNFVSMGSTNKKVITEHYKLAWTAYAILPFKPGTDAPCDTNASLCDLKLCYNYQPWEGDRITLTASNKLICPGSLSTIITNVSVFKFAEAGSTFRFKICNQENIGGDYNVSSCKEKAVIQ